MIRTVVLGAVTFLISVGVAVGVALFLSDGKPADLNAALAETLGMDSVAVDSGAFFPPELDDETALTLEDEVDALIGRLAGVALVGESGDSTAGRDSTARSGDAAPTAPAGASSPAPGGDEGRATGGTSQAAEPRTAAAPPAPGGSGSSAPASSAPVSSGSASTAAAAAVALADVAPGQLPEARLGRIFGSMQPRDAARVLEQMDNRDIATILTMLNDRQAAAVLSNLAPDRAAAISASSLSMTEGG